MISKTFSIEVETYLKIEQAAEDNKISVSKAVNLLIKQGFAYQELIKEQKEQK